MKLEYLIEGCKQQDRTAQERLYRIYGGKFFSLCLKYSNNYEQAKDNLQDGFIKIFENVGQYKGNGSFEGWMTRVIINTSLKCYQNRTIFLSIKEEEIADPEIVIEIEDLSIEFLTRIIQELPDRYRLVFNLYVLEGFSHKEIAKVLKISEGTSKSNLSRARMKLKEKIEAGSLSNSRQE